MALILQSTQRHTAFRTRMATFYQLMHSNVALFAVAPTIPSTTLNQASFLQLSRSMMMTDVFDSPKDARYRFGIL
jgi:hypothetical protein